MAVDTTDIRALWPGTAASIPAGWTRDTNFDSKFLQGFTSAGANAGGTHLHSASHTHTGNSHTHSVSAGTSTGTTIRGVASTGIIVTTDQCDAVHTHVATDLPAATITYDSRSVTAAAATANPPYFTVIIIKPDDTAQDIPDDAVVWTNETSITGFSVCDGVGGTPDLDGLFVLGAAAGADGGGTGGSATHTHTASASHPHTPTAHAHGLVDVPADPFLIHQNSGSVVSSTLHHQCGGSSGFTTNTSSSTPTFDAATSEPLYYTLLAIQNTSGAGSTPIGVITFYVGAAASLPSTWGLCNGTGGRPNLTTRQIKCTSDTGSIGTTGGATTHTHNSPVHGHTHSGSHTHTAAPQLTNEEADAELGSAQDGLNPFIDNHTHTWTIATTTPTLQDATFTTGSGSTRAPYRTVIFVKRQAAAGFAHSWGTVI